MFFGIDLFLLTLLSWIFYNIFYFCILYPSDRSFHFITYGDLLALLSFPVHEFCLDMDSRCRCSDQMDYGLCNP